MMQVLWTLAAMTLGGGIVYVSWLAAWRMYKRGKAEGQGQPETKTRQAGGAR